MRSQLLAIGALSTLLLLLGAGVVNAAPTRQQEQPAAFSLNFAGVIQDAGGQTYQIRGGTLVGASIFGNQIEAGSATISYGLAARVSGLAVYGVANFFIRGVTTNGSSITVAGVAPIDQLVGSPFPLGCAGGTVDPCTSTIPIVFNGTANVVVRVDGQVTRSAIPMAFESAYFDPFGNPIFFASQDLSILVVLTYGSASVGWQDVVTGGNITGSYDGSPASGQFVENVYSTENLANGVEKDVGTTTFESMSPPSLDASGLFSGTTLIPTTGFDCSAALGFPEGTCMLTGAGSTGLFAQKSSTSTIIGQYGTIWSVPSLTFASNVTGIVRTR